MTKYIRKKFRFLVNFFVNATKRENNFELALSSAIYVLLMYSPQTCLEFNQHVFFCKKVVCIYSFIACYGYFRTFFKAFIK